MALQQILKAPLSRFLGASASNYSNDFTLFSSKFPNSVILSAWWVKAPRNHPVRSFAASSSEKIKVLRKKRRLDEVCLERFQQYSRTFIQSWITQGKVIVDGKVVNKCGTQISDKSVVEIKAEVPKYVCRAGHKLEAAIEQLEIDVTGKVALDSGLSTGGFTDCLLQYGASFVYGVDVGYGQVADKIRRHDCVTVIERTNLRYLSELPQKVGGGGIVRDSLVHQEVLAKIINGVQDFGFQCKGWIDSPLKGADGNKEFLACFSRTAMKEEEGISCAKPDIAKLHRVMQDSTQSVI